MNSCNTNNKKVSKQIVSGIGLRGKQGPQGPPGVGTPLFSVTLNLFRASPSDTEMIINPATWIFTNPNFINSSFDTNTGLFTVPADGYYLFNSTIPYTVDPHENLAPDPIPIVGFKKHLHLILLLFHLNLPEDFIP